MGANNRITVNVTDAEYAALAQLAKNNRVSLAWLGRRAMAELVDKYRDRPGQMSLSFPSAKARGDSVFLMVVAAAWGGLREVMILLPLVLMGKRVTFAQAYHGIYRLARP